MIKRKGIDFALKPHCEVTACAVTLPATYRVRSNNTAVLVVAPDPLSFVFTSPIKLKKQTRRGGI